MFTSGNGLNPVRFPDINGPPIVRREEFLDGPTFADLTYARGQKRAAINLDHVAYMTYDLDA